MVNKVLTDLNNIDLSKMLELTPMQYLTSRAQEASTINITSDPLPSHQPLADVIDSLQTVNVIPKPHIIFIKPQLIPKDLFEDLESNFKLNEHIETLGDNDTSILNDFNI